jgi:hypothetical protein
MFRKDYMETEVRRTESVVTNVGVSWGLSQIGDADKFVNLLVKS